MTKITSKQWRFWHWILMRWPFLRGRIWLDNRRRDAFYKWKENAIDDTIEEIEQRLARDREEWN